VGRLTSPCVTSLRVRDSHTTEEKTRLLSRPLRSYANLGFCKDRDCDADTARESPNSLDLLTLTTLVLKVDSDFALPTRLLARASLISRCRRVYSLARVLGS
jgi:hypothetical protein